MNIKSASKDGVIITKDETISKEEIIKRIDDKTRIINEMTADLAREQAEKKEYDGMLKQIEEAK